MNTMLRALSAITVLAVASPAQTDITIHVECGPQHIVDHEWTVDVTVSVPDGAGGFTEHEVRVNVTKYSGAESIAGGLANKLNRATGRTDFGTDETENPTSNEEDGEDLVLPEGVTLVKVRTRKRFNHKQWKEKNDHLKVRDGQKILNDPPSNAPIEDER